MNPELVKTERWKCSNCGMMYDTKERATRCCDYIDYEFKDLVIKRIDLLTPTNYTFGVGGIVVLELKSSHETNNINLTFYFDDNDAQIYPVNKKDKELLNKSNFELDEIDDELEEFVFNDLTSFLGSTLYSFERKIGKIT